MDSSPLTRKFANGRQTVIQGQRVTAFDTACSGKGV